eukprot:15481583-Alexandrium_andersonii.AAC.1
MAAWVSDTTTPTIMRVFRIARVGKALGKVLRIQRLGTDKECNNIRATVEEAAESSRKQQKGE